MFVIIHEGSVIKGPNPWNKLRFEEVLREECEVEYTLETRNDDSLPIIISDTVKILPVVGLPQPEYNPRTQYIHGPFWNFSDTVAEMYYTPEFYTVDNVKAFFMDKVTAHRYVKETSGVKVTIQGTEVSVDTGREARNIFVQAFSTLLDTDTVNWKFPERWLTISKEELGTVISAGRDHIQSCFDWENTWHGRVNAATTLDALNTLYDELEAELPNPFLLGM